MAKELLERSGSELRVEMMGEQEQDSSLLRLAVRPVLYSILPGTCLYMLGIRIYAYTQP